MKTQHKRNCLSDREVALFVDLKAGYKDYDRVLSHISVCRDCLDKTVEIERLLKAEEIKAPRELVERAFRKSAIEIGKSMNGRPFWHMRTVATLAAAASVFILVLAGIYFGTQHYDKGGSIQTAEVDHFSADDSVPVTDRVKEIPKRTAKAVSRKGVYKLEIRNKEFAGQPLMHAGYLFFLLSNSEKQDKELFDKFVSVIAGTKLYSKNSIVLLKQGWFELFQKEISSLPEKDLDDFAEGYILSLLYHSDVRGKVSRTTLEWGRRLALHASMEEIRQCMLYKNSDLFRE